MQSPSSGSAAVADAFATAPAGSRRILVAEDNPISRMLIAHQLSELGCDPVCTDDGEQAAAAWRKESFALSC